MIKRLRRQFVLTTMSILIVLFAIIIITLNLAFVKIGQRQNMSLLRNVAQGRIGSMAKEQDTESVGKAAPDAFKTQEYANSYGPIYIVQLDPNDQVLSVRLNNGEEEIDEEEILGIISKIISLKQKEGNWGSYLFYRSGFGRESVLTMMDARQSLEAESQRRLLIISLGIGTLALALLFVVSLFLSRFVTKPAEETFKKQKQFISDASHELKTPLSVISVNVDVLSSEIGPNKYMDYIRSETSRMDGLIHQLLELARMEDASRPLNKTYFDLSEATYQIALPFESTAYEHQITYDLRVQEGMMMYGERESIQQVAAILIDNAFKHTPDEGKVMICLKPMGERIRLEVFNTGEGIAPADLPHVFERFYKSDKARLQKTGSYGLGLAIAQSIVQAHGGTIRAESRIGKWARFVVILKTDAKEKNRVIPV